jgi:hypothetical protein
MSEFQFNIERGCLRENDSIKSTLNSSNNLCLLILCLCRLGMLSLFCESRLLRRDWVVHCICMHNAISSSLIDFETPTYQDFVREPEITVPAVLRVVVPSFGK